MTTCDAIHTLIAYAKAHQLLAPYDEDYAYNKLHDLLQIDTCNQPSVTDIPEEPSIILQPLLDEAVAKGLIAVDTVKQRDLFEAKIMDIVIPRPQEVIHQFQAIDNPLYKTNFFYHFSKQTNYIKTSRTNKNIVYHAPTPYGEMDITINLSKPEKDPKDIILQGSQTSVKYPKCLLCKENVGYNGASTGIGRTNHRIIPLTLNNEPFYFQYSPYVYYNEHCIVLHEEHIPMNVSEKTFQRLFDFVDQFPHYFLGSNAGLPIVGGSILAHEHYQGGRYQFPIEQAKVLHSFEHNGITVEQLYWPLSVIRLRSKNRRELVRKAMDLYNYWVTYNNADCEIYATTDTTPHNAITPIARKKGEVYELDITLRNNRTSSDFPLGIFHPHPSHHHIKKENIGLIEVMGLAVLPARLQGELDAIKDALQSNNELPKQYKLHQEWFTFLQQQTYDDIDQFVEEQVALKFTKVLEDAGVFKQTSQGQAAFDQFFKEVRDVFHKENPRR
ncbi:UDP-glucose--hexose-1-phosphate uridylyltransferase [Candidatus Xianfuyuplasma coldseepsis]|uniref:Galactose-1-phosphate uridylyltransferase n=1 Tax=Candidatus Xianfuyuplasma coldseepsis TaxID=2782163 RepID=A0A7L7KQ13_9MOLU|nr:UDP-glucose--hexose-1-phosphate uridylyltransferase [Xianfuyuplasma coldseepsis]QMS84352.1 UDP-glucose--hexose-1-phosphate uridylyltransferase [Xianfuyuplasma coldseepsis]